MKKIIKRYGKLYFLLYMILSLAGALSLSSCKNNVMEMLDKTNGHFTAKEVPYDYSLNPGDEGFDENAMLMPRYYVGTRMSLALVGPEAATYYWSLWSLEKTETSVWVGADEVKRTEFAIPRNIDQYSKNFTFYVPEVTGLTPNTYELALVVTDKNGEVYVDTAELVVYDQYYIETIEQ